MGLMGIYRKFHPNTKECSFFLPLHGTVSKTYHILRHKTSLVRYKKIEMTYCILSDHHGLKLDVNNRNKLKNLILNEKWAKTEIEKEIKGFLEFNKNECKTYSNLWDIMKAVLKGKLIALNTYMKKAGDISTRKLTVHLKFLEQKEEITLKKVDSTK